MQNKYKISVIIPVFNEEKNIEPLYGKIKEVLADYHTDCEIIFVDDGSTDGSFKLLDNLAQLDLRIKVIKFRRNFGQSSALMAGINMAKAPVLITMDGDLQNDPADIPKLIKKLNDGYDLVSGWRRKRYDSYFHRKFPSWIANKLLSLFSGCSLHDYGCTLRAYKAGVAKQIKLHSEMHRFLPILVAREGGRMTEIEVIHHPRKKGKSSYGMERAFKVLLDFFLFKFFSDYTTRPIHFFGYLGFFSVGCGFLVGILTLCQRYVFEIPGVALLPLIILTMFCLLIGLQTLFIGLLAEIGIRTYYEFKGNPTYDIEKIVNNQEAPHE